MRNFALIPLAVLLLSCTEQRADDTMNADDIVGNDSRPKFPCEAIENLLATAEDCADLTAMQEDVKPGPAALDALASMVRGKTYEVTLVMDRPKPAPPPSPSLDLGPDGNAIDAVENVSDPVRNASDAIANADEPLEPAAGSANMIDAAPTANEVAAELPGRDTRFPAQVGRYMKATLTGVGFDIKPLWPLDGVREIPRGGQGRWQWEVIPRMAGQRRLTVQTQAMGKVDGKMVPLGNGDTSQDVDVTVSWSDRFFDFVKYATGRIDLLTAFFVALAALIGAIGPVRRAIWGFISGLFKRWRSPPPRE